MKFFVRLELINQTEEQTQMFLGLVRFLVICDNAGAFSINLTLNIFDLLKIITRKTAYYFEVVLALYLGVYLGFNCWLFGGLWSRLNGNFPVLRWTTIKLEK